MASATWQAIGNPGFRLTYQRNVLWVAWGAHTNATALVVMQFCLAALIIRAAMKTNAAIVG